MSGWNESDQTREVYARYGLAMYFAQVVEHGMANIGWLLSLSAHGREASGDLEAQIAKTFGELVNDLRRRNGPPHLVEVLEEARRLRNFLAHAYFKERIDHFVNSAGRTELVAELCGFVDRFQEIDTELEDIALWLGHQHGLTRELLEGAVEELRSGGDLGSWMKRQGYRRSDETAE